MAGIFFGGNINLHSYPFFHVNYYIFISYIFYGRLYKTK